MRNILKKIFSVEKNNKSIKINILGIKIRHGKTAQIVYTPTLPNDINSIKIKNQVCMCGCCKHIDDSFCKKFDEIEILDKYRKLIANLDDKSITVVNNVIHRSRLFNKGERAFLVSEDEFNDLSRATAEFMYSIIEVSKDIYAYKHYILPIEPEKFNPTVFINKHFINEIENLEKIKNNCIIDAGGYVGDSALVFSEYTNDKVYSFEPSSNLCKLFKQTIELNNLNNVELVKSALGSNISSMEINFCGNYTSTKNFNLSSEKEIVNVDTIDNFVRKNNLKVGLIKTDVEGFEKELMLGAINTIKEQKPTMLISIYHSYEDFFELKALIENWDLGYSFKIRKPSSYSYYCDITLICEVKSKTFDKDNK